VPLRDSVGRHSSGQRSDPPHGSQCFGTDSIATDLHALLVVARGAVVGVNDGVGRDAVGVVGLSPRVDGVHVWSRVDAQRVGKWGDQVWSVSAEASADRGCMYAVTRARGRIEAPAAT
jgi:hypothetical protein